MLSTFLKFFKSFFLRAAVVGVEGLFVLFVFGVLLEGHKILMWKHNIMFATFTCELTLMFTEFFFNVHRIKGIKVAKNGHKNP